MRYRKPFSMRYVRQREMAKLDLVGCWMLIRPPSAVRRSLENWAFLAGCWMLIRRRPPSAVRRSLENWAFLVGCWMLIRRRPPSPVPNCQLLALPPPCQ